MAEKTELDPLGAIGEHFEDKSQPGRMVKVLDRATTGRHLGKYRIQVTEHHYDVANLGRVTHVQPSTLEKRYEQRSR